MRADIAAGEAAAAGGVGRRLPAEWEPQGGAMLMWPHEATDWAPMLGEVCDCFAAIGSAVADEGTLVVVAPDTRAARRALAGHPRADRIIYFDCPTNDTWARDAGPLCVALGERDAGGWEVADFGFDGWGGKFPAALDNAVTRRMARAGLLRGRYADRRGYVLEGGSIDSDGCGTLLTTTRCLCNPNRNGGLTKAQVEARLAEWLGARTVLWLDHGAMLGDDTDSHVDTLARFAPGGTIVYTGCADPADAHHSELSAMKSELAALRTARGEPFRLVELPLPDAISDDEGNRLPATYANFLTLNHSILMPTYGQAAKDRKAAQALREAYPGRRVRPIDCRPLIKQHGSLHCVTMQLPAGALPI